MSRGRRPDASNTFRTRSVKRRELAAQKGGTLRQLRRAFRGDLSRRLDVFPHLEWASNRVRLVLNLIDDAQIGSELHARLRSHPGKRCNFEPTVIIAAIILGVMAGLSGEVTDIVKSFNALPAWARLELGAHDDDGYFVSYGNVHHQLTRTVDELERGWLGADGSEWNLDRALLAVLEACPTTSSVDVVAAALDGFAYEAWIRPTETRPKINPDDEVEVQVLEDVVGETLDDEPNSSPIEFRASQKTDFHPPRPRRRDIDCGAKWGKKTPTHSRDSLWIWGYELHLIREVVGGDYWGDPTSFTLADERPLGRIIGFDMTSITKGRGQAGVAITTQAKQLHPTLREVIADRGYTNLTPPNFRDPIESMGVDLVLALTSDDLTRKPEPIEVPLGRRNVKEPKGSAVLMRTAGSLFHELTPPELLVNPRLGAFGSREREAAIAHYEERAAYEWSPHGKRGGSTLRLICPVHSGKVRPLDPIEATRTGMLNRPALRHDPLILKCCEQSTLTVTREERGKLYQEVPFGTRAWMKSYGRRNLIETTNSLIRSQLLRISHGFTRVWKMAKTKFILGLSMAAINLMMYETRADVPDDVVVDDLQDVGEVLEATAVESEAHAEGSGMDLPIGSETFVTPKRD